MGFFDKIKKIGIFNGFSQLDDDFYDELEESLILADTGMDTTLELVEELRRRVKDERIKTIEEARACMCRCVADALNAGDPALDLSTRPSVVLFIGVNGVGKTTTIAKLAHRARMQGKKVMIAAGVTFRAAAIEQLQVWAERVGALFHARPAGSDPASVAFEAVERAVREGVDVLFVDTAGRLQTKVNLMEELTKIRQVLGKKHPGAPHRSILVLDATTGQNGLIQARQFKEAAGLTGIVLTKLDGTAKGGIVIAIAKELGVPVKLAGVGEGVDDLKPFDAKEYVEAII